MNTSLTRREFLKQAGRMAALAALTLWIGDLVTRPLRHKCTSNGICRACSSVGGCALPQALSYREARRRGDV